MLYMVIERFKDGDPSQVGERFQRIGRRLPPGVVYLTSWMTADGQRCFQIMEAPDLASMEAWTVAWDDLVDFEVVPVVTSVDFWSSRS